MSCRGGSDGGVVCVFSKFSNDGVVGFVHGFSSSCGVWCCVSDFGSGCHGIVVYECGLDSMVCGGGGDGSDVCVIRVVIVGVVG